MNDQSAPDVMRILRLIQESDIETVHLKMGETEVFLSRSGTAVPPSTEDTGRGPAASTAAPPAAAPPAPSPVVPAVAAPAPVAPAVVAPGVDVLAPMIGTFYHAPQPGADPYVQVGSVVTEETTVGLIEAMKVFTAVSAGTAGVVGSFLAENNSFVEFGQPLLRITGAADGHRGV